LLSSLKIVTHYGVICYAYSGSFRRPGGGAPLQTAQISQPPLMAATSIPAMVYVLK